MPGCSLSQHNGSPTCIPEVEINQEQPRINHQIRAPQVRLISPLGQQVGIVPTAKALAVAEEAGLDLVEVAPDAVPPVAKIIDYAKWSYEQKQKAKEARRNQHHTVVQEMKLRPRIADHDYYTKTGHVRRFLLAGSKVKLTIMFRGREQSKPEIGRKLLQRAADDMADISVIETGPTSEGRNMTMILTPMKTRALPKQQDDHSVAA